MPRGMPFCFYFLFLLHQHKKHHHPPLSQTNPELLRLFCKPHFWAVNQERNSSHICILNSLKSSLLFILVLLKFYMNLVFPQFLSLKIALTVSLLNQSREFLLVFYSKLFWGLFWPHKGGVSCFILRFWLILVVQTVEALKKTNTSHFLLLPIIESKQHLHRRVNSTEYWSLLQVQLTCSILWSGLLSSPD